MTKTSSSTSNSGSVDLWYSRCGAATASALAIRQNWLQEEFGKSGTVLRSLRDSEDRAVLDSHYHHHLSGLFREGGNIPPIWARAGGSETAVVGITWLDEYQGILTRRGGPIETIGDLAGKRLGIPLHGNLIDFQRGAAVHGFVTALRLAGLDKSQATFVDLPAPPRSGSEWSGRDREAFEVEALLAGNVDAVFLRFARGVRASRDPRLHQVININEQSDPLTRVNNGTPRPVTVDRLFLEQHRDVVVRYLAVLLRTASWAENHPKEVLRLLSHEGSAETVDEVLTSHGPRVHLSFTPQLSQLYVGGLEVQKNFLRDHGFLKADFDVASWIEPGPLAEARELVRANPQPLVSPVEPQKRQARSVVEESLA